MKLKDLVAALCRRLRKQPAAVKESDPKSDDDLLGPEGPLGPTGGQVGNPQRF